MLALHLDFKALWKQIALALLYGAPAILLDTITGNPVLDGLIGVLLGLAICSLPARNTIDALFANRFALAELRSGWAGRSWLALNGLALLAGWAVIWLGMVSLAASG